MLQAVTFIIADNQAITSAGIKAYARHILNISDFEEARSKKELISRLTQHPHAVVVMDYTTLDFKGIEDFLILHNRFEEARWLLFSASLSEQFVRQVASEDNVSILFKDCQADEIRDALMAPLRGDRYICRQVRALLSEAAEKPEPPVSLTPTEIEILKLIAQGNSVKEIAAKRCSSTHTITTHKKNIFFKLGVNNVYEATKYALRAGLVELMEYYI